MIEFAWRYSTPIPHAGCWCWDKTIGDGYGVIVDPRKPFNRASPYRVRMHRIVCEARHGSMSEDMDARHLCHNKCCVNPDHIVPGTRADNVRDSAEAGHFNFTRAEGNGRAKITMDDAHLIRSIYRRGVRGEAKIYAIAYGISESMVRKIVRGDNWKHQHEKSLRFLRATA